MLRAFIKAELLRFLRASSKQEYFVQARQNFWHQLVARGYPVYVTQKWFRLVRWSDRSSSLRPKNKEEPDHFIFPSSMNHIWDFVLIKQLRDVIMNHWTEDPDLHPSLINRFVVSLKRTTSLFDYTRNWNRYIQQNLISVDEREDIADSSDDVSMEFDPDVGIP
jgi:hypothetical protein